MRLVYCVLGLGLALSAAAPAAAEKVGVQGDELTDELRAAVEAALPEEDAPETAFEARRQARRAAQVAIDALNAAGRFAAEADTGVDPGPPPTPFIRVRPGPAFSIGEAKIRFVGARPTEAAEAAARAELDLPAGRAAVPEDVISAEQRIVDALRQQGYPEAEVLSRDVAGDKEAATISPTYRVSAGPRVRFGTVRFEGEDLRTKPSYLNKLSPIETGGHYDPGTLSTYSSRLVETRLFDTATVRLADEASGTTEEGEEVRDVVVRLDERPRHTAAVGGFFGTTEGVGVDGELTRRNFTRNGDSLTLTARIAQLERSLGLQWRLPNQPSLKRTLTFEAGGSNETTDAFDQNTAFLGGAVETKAAPGVFYSLGARYTFTDETTAVSTDSTEEESRTLHLVSLRGATRIDKSNDELDPTKGWRLQSLVEPTAVFGDDPNEFVRLSSQVSGYQPLDEEARLVLAGRLRAGAIFGAPSLELPVESRFFSGGGGSVRGFGFQEVGPRDLEGDPVGGRGLLETSAEVRWRALGALGFAAFIDGGSVTTNNTPTFDGFVFGAGVGVRYATPAGPIRLDVAFPINGTEFDQPVQVYISIGQAF